MPTQRLLNRGSRLTELLKQPHTAARDEEQVVYRPVTTRLLRSQLPVAGCFKAR